MNFQEVLAFELIERAVRLYSHIERSCRVAAIPGLRQTAQMQIATDLKEHLSHLVSQTILYVGNESNLNDSQRLDYLEQALEHLSEVHSRGLLRIPRPHEPIELISYLRQVLLNVSTKGERVVETVQDIPKIFATEMLGDQAHDRFSFQTWREKLSVAANEVDLSALMKSVGLTDSENESRERFQYISLPRIDLGNPCRWPSLLHEVGHSKITQKEVIENFFADIATTQRQQVLQAIGPYSCDYSEGACTAELAKWLVECWCDAYAVIHAGPATFFAQLHAFIFSQPRYLTAVHKAGSGYPPAWFRLKLLLRLSEGRLSDEDAEMRQRICKAMEEERDAIFSAFHFSPPYQPDLVVLLHYFSEFLRSAFPRDKYTADTRISSVILNRLISDLERGLPIPSVSVKEDDREQRAATTAEILLAGWLHRGISFRRDFFDLAFEPNKSEQNHFMEMLAKVDRSDETLKRSIQMAEWFSILTEGATSAREENNGPLGPEPRTEGLSGLLSDRDINSAILAGELRIIPLIDSDLQVRGSVIDLRLGHNFEVFHSNVPRLIDPMLPPMDDAGDSVEIDIDFTNGIEIGPGQFILAHTLEYIKLPLDVAAQIEGRSSFARLGLQVHMTANLVEAGFDGCLTLEILNSGPSTIKLYPGMRIAQLRFYRFVTPPRYPYGIAGENKYRGRLSHNKGQQFSDWEVSAINSAKKRLGFKND